MEREKKLFVFGEDYGTSFVKFGPVWLGEKPDVIENRGYFPRVSRVLERISGVPVRKVVVGPDVADYLETREDLSRLVYPMRHGVIPEKDEKAWRVVKEVTRYALLKYAPKGVSIKAAVFEGFWCVAAIAAQAPRYMYEKLFAIHREINEEEGRKLVKAVTIIPQPLAVAIAHKAVSCVVVEGGHGNTQITPISRYVIRGALIPLNRGGSDANRMAAQILKDAGYGDLAKDEYVVEIVKRRIGLVPRNFKEAIRVAKENPDRFAIKVKINPLVEIELRENAWTRFLIGEIIFNPRHEEFQSYIQQGRLVIEDAIIGDMIFYGEMDIAEALINSIKKVPVEIQDKILSTIILSGGAFNWSVPPGLEDVAVNSVEKVKIMVTEKLPDLADKLNVRMVQEPQFSVWRGALTYGYALPLHVKWSDRTKEGWYSWK